MKIGKIISIEFDKFKVRLFHSTKHSTVSINGQMYYFGNIGSYLKTLNSIGESVLCEVVAVVDYSIDSKTYTEYNLDSSKELIIKPIGTLTKEHVFCMGVGLFPSLYSDVEIVTFDDLTTILSPSNSTNSKCHKTICLGYSKSLINYKIDVCINDLFNIHTAILGNSGSGKSNTLAHLLQEVYRKTDYAAVGAKTILFDVNGEYAQAFSNMSSGISVKIYRPNILASSESQSESPNLVVEDFYLPYYLLKLDEWLAFLMASERTQKPFWDKVLQQCYKFYKIFTDHSESAEYINYFKWKICSLLNLVNSQIESDTVKVTAARSIIMRCSSIVNDRLHDSSPLSTFLNNALSSCSIRFGNNEGNLSSFIRVTTDSINEVNALKIDSLKLRDGEYYDFSFLETAVEMTLLEEEARGNVRIREFASTMLSRLDFFINNSECGFMRNNSTIYGSIDDYLANVFGITSNAVTDVQGNSVIPDTSGGHETLNELRISEVPETIQNREMLNVDTNNQLIIIDSSEVSSDILELMTSVVSRMLFDFRKKQVGEQRRKKPIHIFLDEAHRYIKKNTDYILKENIFEKIAREGRKYSIYLIVSSQRPSELSSTVLSQCGNYIVHRIQNELDIKYIYSVLPYFSDDFITKIKQAVPGEALIFGNCVPMPLKVKMIQACPDPNSENCKINEEWFIPNISSNN